MASGRLLKQGFPVHISKVRKLRDMSVFYDSFVMLFLTCNVFLLL